ncbi:MAG: CoA transferase [Caulobacter sp.]|nr:CoA transferase [Caulobacter sp.]
MSTSPDLPIPDLPVNGRAGILSGYRILDLSSIIMGPYATQMLGDLGAEVICVEPLLGGGNRVIGPARHRELSGVALNVMRNKRSLSIDLKTSAGRAAVLKVAATCDAVVSNMRGPALERLGLDYENVRKIRPDVVYCWAQGFRADSSRANDPAYDDIIQAECGFVDAGIRTGHEPMLAPTILADKVSGYAVAQGVLAGLLHHARTGQGQLVEAPMLEIMRAFMLVEHGAGAVAFPEGGTAGYPRVLNPQRGPQRTRDGWLNILPYSQRDYEVLFEAGGRIDLLSDPRITGRGLLDSTEFLYGELRKITPQRTTAEWLAFCKDNDIPVGVIANLDDIVRELPIEKHPAAGDYRLIPPPVRYGRSPGEAHIPAPLIGQDTEAVLLAAGLTQDDVEALWRDGVIRLAGRRKAEPARAQA